VTKSKPDGDNVVPAARQLASYIQRVENVEAEIKAHADDRKEIYSEAKGNGFDTRTIREIVKRRKLGREKTEERDALLAVYETNLDSILD